MPRDTTSDQAALFGVSRVPNLLSRDLRTVGELLADTDFHSRQILLHLLPEDAAHLIVGWPQVLFAARELWVELPAAPRSAAAREQQRLVDRLVAHGNGYMTELQQAGRYLGGMEADSRLVEVADTLQRAAKLVRKFGGDVDVTSEPARGDLLAAQTRILHTLFLTVHAAYASTQLLRTASVSQRIVASEAIPGLRGYRLARVAELLERWTNRLGWTEAVVARALNGRFPSAIEGEVTPPPESVVRLPRALATWEIATHNHLAANPSNADIALIALGEQFIAAASRQVLTADRSLRDREVVEDCENAATKWAKTASWWRILSPPGSPVHSQLLTAAGELRAAIRALTLDHGEAIQPELIATHPGHPPAVESLLAALEDSRQVAQIVRDFSHDPNLHGPARSLSRASQNLSEEAPGGGGDVVWVSPADTMTNKMIPVPRPIRDGLRADADALQSAAGMVATSAVQAGRPSTDGPTTAPHLAIPLPAGAAAEPAEVEPPSAGF